MIVNSECLHGKIPAERHRLRCPPRPQQRRASGWSGTPHRVYPTCSATTQSTAAEGDASCSFQRHKKLQATHLPLAVRTLSRLMRTPPRRRATISPRKGVGMSAPSAARSRAGLAAMAARAPPQLRQRGGLLLGTATAEVRACHRPAANQARLAPGRGRRGAAGEHAAWGGGRRPAEAGAAESVCRAGSRQRPGAPTPGPPGP